MAGDDCADCPGLHGKEVPIDGKFAQRGELSDDRFVPAAGLGHPPLCDGCECVVLAVGPVLNDSATRPAESAQSSERPMNINVSIAPASVTMNPPTINVTTPPMVIADGAIQLTVPERSVDVHNTIESLA